MFVPNNESLHEGGTMTAPRLFLRDTHLLGSYILVNPRPMSADEYTVETHGSGMLIADRTELRRFALDIIKEVGEE